MMPVGRNTLMTLMPGFVARALRRTSEALRTVETGSPRSTTERNDDAVDSTMTETCWRMSFDRMALCSRIARAERIARNIPMIVVNAIQARHRIGMLSRVQVQQGTLPYCRLPERCRLGALRSAAS